MKDICRVWLDLKQHRSTQAEFFSTNIAAVNKYTSAYVS